MLTRRQFLSAGATAAACSVVTSAGCSGANQYSEQTASLRRMLNASGSTADQLQELVRCATLAANGHNTQPWQFSLQPERITIRPDISRRTPAVDPDDHHLWVSLGCATENLVQAAKFIGKHTDVVLDTQQVHIALSQAAPEPSELVDAIFQRQCTRAEYDGRPLPQAMMQRLQQAAVAEGVELRLITDKAQLNTVLEYVTAGNSAQMRDPNFVAELKHWLRFNATQAEASGDGLYTASSGNATSPSWLGSRLFNLFFTEKSENDRYAKQIRSSAGVAVLVGSRAEPASWFEVGRVYERLALIMTALGIRNSFINQPVEVPAVRTQFAQWLGAPTQRPDLVFRFGMGPLLPYSMRRPVAQVIV